MKIFNSLTKPEQREVIEITRGGCYGYFPISLERAAEIYLTFEKNKYATARVIACECMGPCRMRKGEYTNG